MMLSSTKLISNYSLVAIGIVSLLSNQLCGFSSWITNRSIIRPARPWIWGAKIREYGQRILKEYNANSITLTSSDGYQLAAYWIERPNAHIAVVMCHGHQMTKELMLNYLPLFPNASILMLDFRGHGQSGGLLTSFGIKEKMDIVAALDFIRSHTDPCTNIIGFGFSMAGLPLLQVATQNQNLFDLLILDGAFASLEMVIGDMCKKQLGDLPCRISKPFLHYFMHYIVGIDVTKGNSTSIIENLTIPILLIHSEHDQTTNVRHAHTLYGKKAGSKELWLVKYAGHGNIIKMYQDLYIKIVDDFIKKYLRNRCIHTK